MEAAVYRLIACGTIQPTRLIEAIHGSATGDTVEACQRLIAFAKSVACARALRFCVLRRGAEQQQELVHPATAVSAE